MGDDFRATVAAAAKRFKSSWVDLGKLLVKVRDEALFEDWGYPTFEAYCLGELRIRKATALKLVRSFGFLARHEKPQVLERAEEVERAPSFEVVEVLAQAEERGQLSSQDYRSIRDSIWNPDRPEAQLRRELAERFPAPPPRVDRDAELRRLLGLARKLHADLAQDRKVPRPVVERAAQVASDLEALVAERGGER